MIILDTAYKTRFVNPQHVIYLELVKGKVTAFVKGKNVDGEPTVEDINVREPWTIVVHLTNEKVYLNYRSFEAALSELFAIMNQLEPGLLGETELKKKVRTLYGKEKI